MAKRSDDSENFIIHGTLTLLNDATNGPGCIEVLDTVYTDIIRPNTLTSVPIDIGEVEFLNKIMTLNENNGSPSNPLAGKFNFYIENSMLKSKNNSGSVTTYQPTTSKGDILVHNGTTQTRLPVSTNSYLLSINSSTSTGLEWVPSPANLLTTKGDLLSHNGTTQVKLPVSTNTYVLTGNSIESSGLKWEAGGKENYIFYNSQSSGTDGGTAATNTWTTVDLNTLISYPTGSSRMTLSTNTITIQPGVYKINSTKAFIGTAYSKIRLRNTTNNTTLAIGSNIYCHRENQAVKSGSGTSNINDIFTITTTSILIIQYFCTDSVPLISLGAAVGGGEAERYSITSIQVLE